MGTSFWAGMLEWMKTEVLENQHNIGANDFDLFLVTDDVEEAITYINNFYTEHDLAPNFS